MLARIRRIGARRAAVVVLTLGLVGVVAVPTILAAPAAQPAQRPMAAGATTGGPAALARRLGRVLRADTTVLKRDGSTMTVHVERGEITAFSSSSITVKGLDGVTTTFAVSADTRIRQRGQEIKLTDLAVGERAMVAGTKTGGGYDALLVRRIPAGLPGAAGAGASAQP